MDAFVALVAALSQEFPQPRSEEKVDDFNILEWANYAKKKARIASSTSKELGRIKAILAASLRPSSYGEPKRRDIDKVSEQDPWSHSKCKTDPTPAWACWRCSISKPSVQDTSKAPAEAPTVAHSEAPTVAPTEAPAEEPTVAPSEAPAVAPTVAPTEAPTVAPTEAPADAPTVTPAEAPTVAMTEVPAAAPTVSQTVAQALAPTVPMNEATPYFSTLEPAQDDALSAMQVDASTPLTIEQLLDRAEERFTKRMDDKMRFASPNMSSSSSGVTAITPLIQKPQSSRC